MAALSLVLVYKRCNVGQDRVPVAFDVRSVALPKMAGVSNSKVMERVKHLDLYDLLGVLPDANLKAIKKAYRQRARDWHPDKNPDDLKGAQERFHRLSDAFEVLSNDEMKKAYDNLLKARKANEIRTKQLDAKQRKLKEDMEAREAAAKIIDIEKQEAWRAEQEIERIRRENIALLEKEKQREEALARSRSHGKVPEKTLAARGDEQSAKLSLRWKGSSAYDKNILKTMFSKYGKVKEVVVIKKGGDKMIGLVEMASRSDAVIAAKVETGDGQCPLRVKLVGEENVSAKVPETTTDFERFESLVLKKLQDAAAPIATSECQNP